MKIHEFFTEYFSEERVPTEFFAYKKLIEKPLKADAFYLAVSWARLINSKRLSEFPAVRCSGGFTVCQHTQYKQILPILVKSGINVLFTPHAEEDCKEVKVLPFPHYAVHGVLPVPHKDILYSFIGVDSTSMIKKDLRGKIFSMKHPAGTIVKSRSQWHWARENKWGNLSEEQQEFEKNEYRDVLARSRFSLCPRGYGASTIRFWESLQAGAIPVLLADTMRLPEGFDWNRCVLRVWEKDLEKIPKFLARISMEQENVMRFACLEAYRLHSGDSFVRGIRNFYGEKHEAL